MILPRLLSWTIFALRAPATLEVAVQATPGNVASERLLRKQGSDERMNLVLTHNGEVYSRSDSTVQTRSGHNGDRYHHDHGGPYGEEHTSHDPSPTPPPPAGDDATFSFHPHAVENHRSNDTQQAAKKSTGVKKQVDTTEEADKSTIYLYKDFECREREVDTGVVLPGVILPANSHWKDGDCIQVDSPRGQPQMVQNLRIACHKDGGAELQLIYGEECAGGVDDKYKFDLSEEAAEGLWQGDCVKAMNHDVYQMMYVRMTLQDDDDILLPGCIYTWRLFLRKHLLIAISAVVGILVITSCIPVLGRLKRSKKKKKQMPEEAQVPEPQEEKSNSGIGDLAPSEGSVKDGESNAEQQDGQDAPKDAPASTEQEVTTADF